MPSWVAKPKSAYDRAMNLTMNAIRAVKAAHATAEQMFGLSAELRKELGISFEDIGKIGAITSAEFRTLSPDQDRVNPTHLFIAGFLAGSAYERENNHEME